MNLATPTGFELEVFDPLVTEGNWEDEPQRYRDTLEEIITKTKAVKFSSAFAHNYWEQHQDGGGIEIGSPVFTRTEQLDAIDSVVSVLFKRKFRPHIHAGTHVHISLAGFKPKEQIALQRFLISVEAGIFATSSIVRVGNHAGRPYMESVQGAVAVPPLKGWAPAFKKAGLGHPALTFVDGPESATIGPLGARLFHRKEHEGWCGHNDWGTLECRCFPSTLDAESIKNWMLTLNLVVSKFREIYPGVAKRGYFPYRYPGWISALDEMADVADRFMTFLEAPTSLRRWAVERAAANYVLPAQAMLAVLPVSIANTAHKHLNGDPVESKRMKLEWGTVRTAAAVHTA